jgi:hypothetical protein
MKQVRVVMHLLLMVLLCGLFSAAQQSMTAANATVPLWDSTSDIIISVLFQKSTGSTAKIGINTIARPPRWT